MNIQWSKGRVLVAALAAGMAMTAVPAFGSQHDATGQRHTRGLLHGHVYMIDSPGGEPRRLGGGMVTVVGPVTRRISVRFDGVYGARLPPGQYIVRVRSGLMDVGSRCQTYWVAVVRLAHPTLVNMYCHITWSYLQSENR